MPIGVSSGNTKERDHLENVDVDGIISIKMCLKEIRYEG
jgi:hypothetical protein